MAAATSRPPEGAAASAEIDARLGALPEDQRAALEALRETIREAAPGAVEAISYSMPAFRYRGRPLVSYEAFRSHCSFFPMSGTAFEAHADELAGFIAGKGTVRFTPDRPLPKSLVVAIVRERMAEIDAKPGRR